MNYITKTAFVQTQTRQGFLNLMNYALPKSMQVVISGIFFYINNSKPDKKIQSLWIPINILSLTETVIFLHCVSKCPDSGSAGATDWRTVVCLLPSKHAGLAKVKLSGSSDKPNSSIQPALLIQHVSSYWVSLGWGLLLSGLGFFVFGFGFVFYVSSQGQSMTWWIGVA